VQTVRRGYRCRGTRTLLAAAVSLTLLACAGSPAEPALPPAGAAETAPPAGTAPPGGTAPPADPGPSASPAPVADPAAAGADELGVVPVLMYHQLVEQPKGVYDQSPAQFRAELERLYAEGYLPVTAADLVAGRIDLPAGSSPVVLTFDDSTTSQYGELADGSVDPASAVGILLAVGRAHGDDSPVATFYVNDAPFAGRPAYLASLHALGMEIGNHTAGHSRLDRLDATGVQRELVLGTRLIEAAAPGAEVTTMSLPLGRHPEPKALAHTGAWDGTSYDLAGVMLVGAGPSRSPYDAAFTPRSTPRVLSGRDKDEPFASTYWLDRIRDTRYVSDGDPDVVSFPAERAGQLAPAFAGVARPY
jgi:peptidoglycan/xylan/chitin deacetylase (PgdA/CDA1 family)